MGTDLLAAASQGSQLLQWYSRHYFRKNCLDNPLRGKRSVCVRMAIFEGQSPGRPNERKLRCNSSSCLRLFHIRGAMGGEQLETGSRFTERTSNSKCTWYTLCTVGFILGQHSSSHTHTHTHTHARTQTHTQAHSTHTHMRVRTHPLTHRPTHHKHSQAPDTLAHTHRHPHTSPPTPHTHSAVAKDSL